MFPEPEYAQIIVVGVLFHNSFAWYIARKEYWYLDYTKYKDALLAVGYTHPLSDRFGIIILDEHTAESFFAHIANQRVPASVLTQMMLVRKARDAHDDLLDFAPCLLINFDQKQFSSQYPEMIRFERYVPDGWTGSYRDFLSDVPEKERYWIVDGESLYHSRN
jgi:hypothetical protein